MTFLSLEPAYGRDYKTSTEVIAAFNAQKDFIGDYSIGFKPINKQQINAGTTVKLRYARLTKSTNVTV